MKITVLTPTIRRDGLELVRKALRRQTEQDFEWLIGSPFNPRIPEARWIEDDFRGGFWTLNRIYNKMIKQTKAPLLVSWQDYTYATPEALEKFLFHFQQEPKTLVTGVGSKYSDETWTVKTWQDPRERNDMGSYYLCYWNDWEGNFAAVPKQALYDVGGFDEKMDFLGFGMDWYGVLNRINDLGGYDFKIDQTNKSYSLEHGRVGGSDRWEKYNLIHGGYVKHREELLKRGKWPVLSYLKK